ncbi:hypothetical protein BT67DRAFT_440783 [Trichocladium antarcticum]|uniref:Uncharacterized protein n=1 Tax=Trichocladium antarcticum TaxID=1450529 RepID=A0AAN6ZEZ3_9PEZI|nr:hypothetical protein BT67DRAFT_440783 [Trichocladium antarcticum]
MDGALRGSRSVRLATASSEGTQFGSILFPFTQQDVLAEMRPACGVAGWPLPPHAHMRQSPSPAGAHTARQRHESDGETGWPTGRSLAPRRGPHPLPGPQPVNPITIRPRPMLHEALKIPWVIDQFLV